MHNRSAPAGDIFPSLIYADVAKAAGWLCHVFGFRERLRVTNQDGAVGHVQLAIGQSGIMLSPPKQGQSPSWDDPANFRPPRPNEASLSLTIRVDDVDRHYQIARERGARILHPPATYPFGERQYSAEDPEGYRWSFTQSVADVNPADWGATVVK
jgi:uncharacterized glyoxalase superfamily protein PhnB